ncbi:hypothetical protein [Kitasatospora sp. NBC_00315]|uniref:hypothetical protein n=1 Tax=Kitasatospora sp. NBC_00315 TaxID=2975963 RepID=UPI00324F1D59
MGVMGRLAVGTAGVGMALAVAAIAVGPRLSDWYEGRHHEQASYASGVDAKAGHHPVPGWLPDDASAVHYLVSTTSDDRLLRATVPGGRLPAGCTAVGADGDRPGAARPVAAGATAQAPGSHRLKAAWFPAERRVAVTGRCGDYAVALAGDQLFAWQDAGTLRGAASHHQVAQR